MTNKLFILLTLAALLLVACIDTNPPIDPIVVDPLEMQTLRQVVYGDHPLQNMDIYLPANRNETTKVVIMVHGGGWVMGYKSDTKVTTFDGRFGWDILNPILDEGYAVAVIKYRTACYNTVAENFNNNTTFYQDRMMEDIDLVINLLKSNADEYHISNNHFQLLGESGGGHIVMTYGIRQNADPSLKSVVSMFGPTHLDAQDFKTIINSVPLILIPPPNYFLKKSDNCESVTNQQAKVLFSLKSFADHQTININQPNDFLEEISTTNENNIQRNIPMFIMQGAADELVPSTQADAMFNAMQNKYDAANCTSMDFSCQLKETLYENCGHGWTGGNCQKDQIMADIVTWINAH